MRHYACATLLGLVLAQDEESAGVTVNETTLPPITNDVVSVDGVIGEYKTTNDDGSEDIGMYVEY